MWHEKRRDNDADSTVLEKKDWSLVGVGVLLVVFVLIILISMIATGHGAAVAGIILLPVQVIGLIMPVIGLVLLAYGVMRERPVVIGCGLLCFIAGVITWLIFLL